MLKGSSLVIAAVLACAGCGKSGETLPEAVLFAPAPSFELAALSEGRIRLADYRGKVVLLDFWATYCLPCLESIPIYQKMHEEYGPRGFSVIGISIDAYTGHVGEIVQELGATYPMALDPHRAVAGPYGVGKLPVAFLIDRSGRLMRRWDGYNPAIGEEMVSEIRKAVQQPAS